MLRSGNAVHQNNLVVRNHIIAFGEKMSFVNLLPPRLSLSMASFLCGERAQTNLPLPNLFFGLNVPFYACPCQLVLRKLFSSVSKSTLYLSSPFSVPFFPFPLVLAMWSGKFAAHMQDTFASLPTLGVEHLLAALSFQAQGKHGLLLR